MRHPHATRWLALFCALMLAAPFFSFTVFAKGTQIADDNEKIIIVADISRSIQDSSSEQNLKNGLKLAIDLAPNNAQIALIAVDSQVQLQTDFLNSALGEQRGQLKSSIDSISCTGGTNLALGLEEAFKVSKANDNARILLLADISEGGLTVGSNYDELTALTNTLSEEAKASNIAIDMILLGKSPENSSLGSAIANVPQNTGGTITYIENSKEFAGAVEDLYFNNYSYSLHSVTGINSTDKEQQVDIAFPSGFVQRGRLYVSAHTPVKGIRATYATAELGAEINASYSMLDLQRPAQDGISLYLDTGEADATKVYLIADYDLSLNVLSSSEVETMEDKSQRQKANLTFDLQDRATGHSVFSGDELTKFSPFLELISPSGKTIPLVAALANDQSAEKQYEASFYPTEFGVYKINGSFKSGDFSIPFRETDANITEALPIRKPWLGPTLLSVLIAIALITGALIFYFRRKKISIETHKGAAQLEETYGFTGKLQFATIIAEGGKREIRPFHFQLDQLSSNKRVSLDQMYDAVGHKALFSDLEKIWVTPGPSGSVVIKNNSKGTILKSGREYGYRDKVQLFYDEKIYIIFERNEDEIEVYYRRSRQSANETRGSKVSIAI